MKKLTFKNAILSVLFALCCVFTLFCISYSSVKVNAVETENQGQTEETENEETTQEEEHKHTEVVVEGKESTCTETGLTAGVVCGECGEILLAQEVIEINPNNHTFGEWVKVDELNEQKTCSGCGYAETREIQNEVITPDPLPEVDEPVVEDEEKGDFFDKLEELAFEIKDAIMIVVGILASLGITWSSIGCICNWAKGKLKSSETNLATTYTEMEKIENKLQTLTEENKKLQAQINEQNEILKDFSDFQKLKAKAIGEVVSGVLLKTKEKGEDKNENEESI